MGLVTSANVATVILQYFILREPEGEVFAAVQQMEVEEGEETSEPPAKRARREGSRKRGRDDAPSDARSDPFLILYRTFSNHYGLPCVRDLVANTIVLLQGSEEAKRGQEAEQDEGKEAQEGRSRLVAALNRIIFLLQDCAR